MSKRYPVAVARERLAEALDEAERGVAVFIERRGVRYRLSVEVPKRARPRRPPRIEIVDPAIEAGTWSWAWTPGGVKFTPGARRARATSTRPPRHG